MLIQKRIQFAQVQHASPWLDFLTQNFVLQSRECLELRQFGALYRNQKRWFPEPNDLLQSGDLVRVHLEPRRFPIELLQDRDLVLHESADWVLLWKPSGLPSHETLDNVIENCKAWVERKLGCRLWSLSRLDVGTRGWLLFAKTAAFAKDFHGQLENHRVLKFYEILGASSPEFGPGLWRHWMRKSVRSPRVVTREKEAPDDFICELDLLGSESVTSAVGMIVKSRVRLLTGRTHQIRAQFAAEGAPLLGDQMYGSDWRATSGLESFALSCERLGFANGSLNFDFARPTQIPALSEEVNYERAR